LDGTRAERLGTQRLVREFLAMPAEVRIGRRGTKLSLRVSEPRPWAEALARGVRARLLPSGGLSNWRKI